MQGTSLSTKEIFSLKKYINRIHFRATPFGLFSFVGTGNWQYRLAADIQNDIQTALTVQTFSTVRQREAVKNIIIANSSGYLINKEIRFLAFMKNAEGQFKWEIKSLEASLAVKQIWKLCREEKAIDSVVNFVTAQFHLTADDALDAVNTLIDSQVLYYKGNGSPLNYLNQKIDSFKGGLTDLLTQVRNANPGKRDTFVVNTFNSTEAQLNGRYLQSVDNALTALGFLSSDDQLLPSLDDFIIKFEKTYDRRMVPLLEALDPEIGIGYDDKNLANVQINEIVQQVSSGQKQQAEFSSSWSRVHSLLLKKCKPKAILNFLIMK